MWPLYLPRQFTDRSLFYYDSDDKALISEYGEVYHFNSLDDIVDVLFEHNGLAFCESFTDEAKFPFLADIVEHDDSTVLCSKKGVPLAIRFKRGSSSRWLVLRKTWTPDNLKPDMEFLLNMRSVYAHCGVGVVSTPGALGTQLMRKTWKEFELQFHTAPSGYAERFIREHQSGGRADTPGQGNFYEMLIEGDRSSAYLAEYQVQPAKTSIMFNNGPSDDMVTWFAHCEVEIPSELALGPFPRRLPDERIVYPTLKGRYDDVYIWKEQAESALRAGCKVRPKEGVGWKEWTDDNSWWCQEIYSLRKFAPSKFVESSIKAAIVAAIGRHAMAPVKYILVPEDRASVFDVPVCGEGVPYAFFVHEEQMDNACSMIHWNGYTLGMAANTLYNFALPYAEQGRLIATNYDSVLVLDGDDIRSHIKRYSAEEIYCPPGGWRWQELHDVYIVAPRSIICNEKVVLPGIERASRHGKELVRTKA